jgi:hypothetical protein
MLSRRGVPERLSEAPLHLVAFGWLGECASELLRLNLRGVALRP